LQDTIRLIDICSDHYLPVQSFGILSNSNANTKCEVSLIFTPKEIAQSFSAIFYSPTPNPAKDIISIDFDISKPDDEEVEFSVFLSNLLGNKFGNYDVIKTSIEQQEGKVIEKGKIVFNIQDLNSGYYLFLCNIQNNIVSFPVIIER